MAIAPDGVITAELRLDTSNVRRDLQEGLAKDQKSYEKDMRSIGKRIGDDISDEIHKHPGLRRAVRDTLTAAERLERNGYRSIGRRIATLIADEFTSSRSPLLQAFKGFQQTFSRLFGSILNLGGGSNPAVFILMLTLISDIVAAVLILIHGIQALIALLSVIPNLLFAIGLQAGALLFIFHGFGTALGALAAAKNINELNNSLKGMNPVMAAVIRQLFPLKQLFSEISDLAKTMFFGELDDVIPKIVQNIRGPLKDSIAGISDALGIAARNILSFFATPLFSNFLTGVTPSIVMWLDGFGKAINTLLVALTNFGNATIPFFNKFGDKFNNLILQFAAWLDRLSNDPNFQKNIDDAFHTLHEIVGLLGEAFGWIKRIEDSFKNAGADQWIDRLRTFFHMVNQVFDIIGPDAMKALIVDLVIFVVLTVEIVVGITAVFYIIWQIYKFIGFIVDSFKELYHWIRRIISGPSEQLHADVKKASDALYNLRANVIGFFSNIGEKILNFLTAFGANFLNFLTNTLPDQLKNAAKTVIDAAYNFGHQIIDNIINGIIDHIPGLRAAINGIKGFLGTLGFNIGGSSDKGGGGGGGGGGGAASAPYGINPITGQPYANQGEADFFGNVPGYTPHSNLTSPTNQTAAFGANSVQINVNSTNPPSQQQAVTIGQNVALGLQQQLVSRSVRTA